MIRTIRIVKTSLFLLVSLAALSVVSGLIYLNQVGFPGGSGEWIRDELGRRGLHLSFDTLRFEPNEGLVATGVSLFQDQDRSIVLLEAEEMILDLDKTKALRGDFKLLGLTLTGGNAKIPVKDENRFLTARQIQGDLRITSNGRAVLRKASANIEGITLKIDADLKLLDSSEADRREDHNQSSQIISSFLDELSLWDLPKDTPPKLSLQISGDLNQAQFIQTSFQFEAYSLSRNNYHLERIDFSGDLRSQIVTLDDLLLQDHTGSITGQADWSLRRRDGRFDLISTLQPQDFSRDCFNHIIFDDFKLTSSPSIKIRGKFAVPEQGPLSVTATGELALARFKYQETAYQNMSSVFSWHDGDLFLRDLEIVCDDKKLEGNVLLKDGQARYDLRSKLPLEAFRPVIKSGSGLELALSHLTFSPDSIVEASLVGRINRDSPRIWSATGTARIDDFVYKGTKVHQLTTDFDLNGSRAAFSGLKALLNDENEKARLRYQGKASGEIQADSILFESASRFVTISNLRGTVWPTPIVRIFAPRTADHLEENYRFYKPPRLTLNGRFAGRREDSQKSTFSVAVRTTGRTDYPFLGSDLPLKDLRADIIVKGTKITVKNLFGSTLGGSLAGSVFCEVNPRQKTSYRGALKWDNVSFKQLSRVYEFDEEEKGTLTGSIDFRGSEGSVRNFNGEGIIAINGGNLVSLPVLGPLSPIIAGLLGDKRMGYERAKDASAHFAVRNGILQTKDFVAISTSVTLTGEGWVDLLTDKMDLVIRVNARGLLGFLTLPLQPLKGIFQFRGTGNYDEPKWRSSPFTRPAKGKKDPIFQTPSRATIVPE